MRKWKEQENCFVESDPSTIDYVGTYLSGKNTKYCYYL